MFLESPLSKPVVFAMVREAIQAKRDYRLCPKCEQAYTEEAECRDCQEQAQQFAEDGARWQRFLDFAGPYRGVCETTRELEVEFRRRVMVAFTGNGREAMDAADWVAENARRVVYQASVVREMYARFLANDSYPHRVTLAKETP